MKKGSTLAFTLLYIALFLILIVGVSYLLGKGLRVQRNIEQGIQASYNAESGIELALYEGKLHREGYEHQAFHKSTDIGLRTAGAIDYSIEYITAPQETGTMDISNSDRQIALFSESTDPTMSAPTSLSFFMSNIPNTLAEKSQCLEVKLSGKKDSAYHTISTTLPCSTQEKSLDTYRFTDTSIMNKGLVTKSSDFLKEHKEVYLIVRVIPTLAQTSTLHIQADRPISSYLRRISATGRQQDLEITKRLRIPQDQSPDILSMALFHR